MQITVQCTDARQLLDNPLVTGLLEHSTEAAVVLDAVDRRVLAMNSRARDLLGAEHVDLSGRVNCGDVMRAESCGETCPLFARLHSGGGCYDTRLDFEASDGGVPVHVRMVAIRNHEGRAIAGIEFFNPVAESASLCLADVERRAIASAMRRCDGNLSRAARLLGIDRTTLWRKLKRGSDGKSPEE